MTTQKKLKVLDYAIDEVTNDRSTTICFPIQVGLEILESLKRDLKADAQSRNKTTKRQ